MIKLKALIIIIYVLFTGFRLQSQNYSENSPRYNSECNVWLFDNNSDGKNENGCSNSLVFTWTQVQSPITSQIQDVYFTDSLNGWVAHLGMGAMRSTNSGFNWETSSFNDTNFTTGFNGVHFINTMTGWCVGGALQIRKTTNGGVNWTRQIPPPVAGILRSIYFFDENTGYGIGSKNFPYQPFVCKTTNSGANWTEISPVVAGAQELNEQHWFNASTGWICGYDVLLYTTNGGANFTNLYSNVPPSGNGHIAILSVQFVNQQTGWLGAANLERNNIYKTTNGGANWFFQNNPISQGGMNQINDVRFFSPDSGWAVHGALGTGAIMFTSNGGTNWVMEEQGSIWFDCLHTYQNKKAWCGSAGGRIWYVLIQSPVGISNNEGIATGFSLGQNYPNPFNPATTFEFHVAKSENVQINVYDILGRKVETLIDEKLNPGTYELKWDASNYPSGVYYYRLTGGNFSDTKKMVLIK